MATDPPRLRAHHHRPHHVQPPRRRLDILLVPGDLAEHHIDLPTRTLVMAFNHDQCAPVRLHGPATPAIALWSAVQIYGDSWKTDPVSPPFSPPAPHTNNTETSVPPTPPTSSPPAGGPRRLPVGATTSRRARTNPSRAHTTSGRDL